MTTPTDQLLAEIEEACVKDAAGYRGVFTLVRRDEVLSANARQWLPELVRVVREQLSYIERLQAGYREELVYQELGFRKQLAEQHDTVVAQGLQIIELKKQLAEQRADILYLLENISQPCVTCGSGAFDYSEMRAKYAPDDKAVEGK